MKLFTHKLKSAADFYTQIVLMAVVVALIAGIFALLTLRVDMTEAHLYSISGVTKETLKNLDDRVTIKAYFTADLPGYLITVRDEVRDMLAEYQNYGSGKVSVRFINPNESPEKEQEAQNLGIPPVQLNVVQQDKFEVAQGYLGIAVLYGDTSEVIPVVENTETLEYDLTVAIKKVVSGAVLTVGIVEKQDSTQSKEENGLIRQVLSKQYQVRDVDLSEGIPDAVTTLIVAGPKGEFSEAELYALDQFIMKGNGVLFLIDGMSVNQGLVPEMNESNMLSLLSSYGITVNKNAVFDPQYNGQASFSQGFMQFFVSYGFWPRILRDGFSKENVLVNTLESITLPWASTLTVKNQEGIEILAKTSSVARTVEGDINLSPNYAPQGSGSGSDAVAVSVSGKVESFFDAPLQEGDETKEYKAASENVRFIVVSDADMLTDSFIERYNENLVFLQNLIDGLTLDPSLAAIRSKTVTERPVKQLDATSRMLIKYGNTIGVPLLVVLIAVVRFAWRRKSQRIQIAVS